MTRESDISLFVSKRGSIRQAYRYRSIDSGSHINRHILRYSTRSHYTNTLKKTQQAFSIRDPSVDVRASSSQIRIESERVIIVLALRKIEQVWMTSMCRANVTSFI